jgi:hypothetical protein
MEKECNVPVAEQVMQEEMDSIETEYTINSDGSIAELKSCPKQLTLV